MSGRYARLLRRYFLPHWPSAAALLVLLLVVAAAEVVRPRLIASFIDDASAGAAQDRLVRLAAGVIALVVAGQTARIAEAWLAERLALIATNDLRADLTEHVLRLDLGFHSQRRPGELIQRIDGDVASLTNFFSRFLVALVANGLLLAGALAMIATIDARLGAILTAFSLAVLVLLVRLRVVARGLWERSMQAQADQSGFLEEQLAATEDVRSSGAVAYAMRRFAQHADDLLRRRRRAAAADGALGAASTSLFTCGTAGALAFAVWLFGRGEVTIGTVFLVFTYTEMLARPIGAINRQIQDLQAAAAAVRRVWDLLDTPAAIAGGPGAPLPAGALRAELRGVGFGYDDGEPVLAGVDVRLEPGRVLGLLGRTGSGKTTITRLLLRFYDAASGEVLVGDVDVRQAALGDLRSRVGLVTQDVQLFHASVRDNLTFFDGAVPDARVEDVLRDLGLSAWLDGLDAGVHTLVSSGATGLSAGEAQLLAFARVFLRDPGLVILDEATSRLDPATQRHVERAVTKLFDGRTAIVIAHRLETVLRADDIVIVEDGRIAEAGGRAALEADESSRFAHLLRTGMQDVLA